MRAPLTRARALYLGTVAAGSGAAAVSLVFVGGAPLATVAVLAAAVVVTELIQVSSDSSSHDPSDAHVFTFSSAVHLAAVMLAGPWAAALVAAVGVVLADSLRGTRWRIVTFNAAVFALATLAGGGVFEALGGIPGTIRLPADLGAVAGLATTYAIVNLVLVNAIVALQSGRELRAELTTTIAGEWSSRAAESGLGLACALMAVYEPWGLIALVPLVFAVYRAHATLATLRRETAHTLETFANIIDERDPYTYRHSARVAGYVEELAEALRLPSPVVARLRWAGRLHDLGKIAVDASVLRKPGRLDAREWSAIRRHPRLSARLLKRFRLAQEEARAVEYHHERYDGAGYYGVDGALVPLAAHFLIVADSFDAMTSDRPYRPGLSSTDALAEIEQNLGSQFHPVVGKAFVACQRGIDPLRVLTAEEREELRPLFRMRPRSHELVERLPGGPELLTLGGVVLVFVLFALDLAVPAAGAASAALAGLCWRHARRKRVQRLRASLEEIRFAGPEALAAISRFIDREAPLDWAGLLAWREHELDGSIVASWGNEFSAPAMPVLTSWLVRDLSYAREVLVAGSNDLAGAGAAIALPIRDAEAIRGFLVLSFCERVPVHVELALRTASDTVADAVLAVVSPPVALPSADTAIA